jgi:hypothetical protein
LTLQHPDFDLSNLDIRVLIDDLSREVVTITISPQSNGADDRRGLAHLAISVPEQLVELLHNVDWVGVEMPSPGPLGVMHTAQQAAARMNVPDWCVLTQVQHGLLIGLRTKSGDLQIPEFQFDADGSVSSEVLAAQHLLEKVARDPWAAAFWICSGSGYCRPPLQQDRLVALKEGGVAAMEVMTLAKETAKEWNDNRDTLSLYDLGPHFLPTLQRLLHRLHVPAELFMDAFLEFLESRGPFTEQRLSETLVPLTMESTLEGEIAIMSANIVNYYRNHYAAAAVEWSEQLFRAWPIEDAARHLSRTPEAIQALIDSHKLVAMAVADTHLLPGWQFTLDGLLYGVDALASAFHAHGMDHQEAHDFMFREHPQLQTDGPTRPYTWLVQHRGVLPILAIVDADDIYPTPDWLTSFPPTEDPA